MSSLVAPFCGPVAGAVVSVSRTHSTAPAGTLTFAVSR